MTELSRLTQVQIPRCLKPASFGTTIVRAEMHTFSDASTKGYGACVYIRLLGEHGAVSCNLLLSKSMVVPLKGSTIPRPEL